MNIPNGKTPAIITSDGYETNLKKGDIGFIDGYVRGGNGAPLAAFVRDDGIVDLVPTYSLRALISEQNHK